MQLAATEAFAGLGQDAGPAGAVPSELLVPDDLLKTAEDPIGFRLLRMMGWREGHGVGPRRKRERARGEDADGADEGDDPAKDFLFAPSDVKVRYARWTQAVGRGGRCAQQWGSAPRCGPPVLPYRASTRAPTRGSRRP